MKRSLFLAVCMAASVLAGAADFSAYEGKDALQEGTGGEKKTVNGVDFWSNGAPPRKFKLLGYITDTRHKSGLVGKMRMAGLEGAIAKKAKEVGGDAVILVGSEAETTGYIGNTNTTANATANTWGNRTTAQGTSWGTTTSVAVQKQHSRYAVVKYVESEAMLPNAAVTDDSSAPGN